MSYPFEYVMNSLEKNNVRVDVFRNSKDSAGIVLPDYNRVLGVWPEVQEISPLWINKRFLKNPNDKSVVWANPGGHRIWVAPEKEFFISDLDRPFETYKVPNIMDPGQYNYKFKNDIFSFSTKINLYAHKSAVTVPLTYERKVKFLKKEETDNIFQLNNTGYKCIAYQDDVSLTTESEFRTGLWSLVQVPLDGEIYLPLNKNADYEVFFGETKKLIEIKDNILKIILNFIHNDFKIGLIASLIKNRILYVKKYNDKTIVIVKVFNKGNDCDYIDTPWKQDNRSGSAAQIFCGGSWGFAELETHAPVRELHKNNVSLMETKVYAVIFERKLSNREIFGLLK